MAKVAKIYRLVRLGFETDSTRSVTLMLDRVSTPVVEIRGETISNDITTCPTREVGSQISPVAGDRFVAYAPAGQG